MHAGPPGTSGPPPGANGPPPGMHGAPGSHGGPGGNSAQAGSPTGHGQAPANNSATAQNDQKQDNQKKSTSGWLGSLFGGGDSGQSTATNSAAGSGGTTADVAANSSAGGHGGPGGPPDGYTPPSGYSPPGGSEGYAGSGPPGAAGGGQAPKYEEGTAEYAAHQVASKLMVGDQSGLENYISDKVRGDFAKFRTGEADQAQLGEAKQALAGVQLINVRETNGGKSVILRNQAGASVTFTTKREEGGYKVTGMKVEKARVRIQAPRRR